MKQFLKLFTIIAFSTTSSLGLSSCGNNSKKDPACHSFYVLGDSLADNGAFCGAASQLASNALVRQFTNWDFQEVKMETPFYDNSCSNGKVFTKIISEKLNLPLIPAWKFKAEKILPFEQKGNNYAVAGAGAVERKDKIGKFLNYFTIQNQVKALLEQHSTIKKNDKFIFEIGSNDIMYAFLEKDKIKADDIIKQSIANQKQALEKLITNGAHDIIILNSQPLQFVPAYNKDVKLQQSMTELVNMYNSNWLRTINHLSSKYEHSILHTFDLNTEMKNGLQWFKKNVKAANITDAATHVDYDFTTQQGILQPKYNAGVSVDNLKNYFFFDNWHPTAFVHKYLANIIYNRFWEHNDVVYNIH